MRDIRILSMVMRDESVPATLSVFDDDIVVTTPMELDENEKDKLVKRFAERIIQLGLSMHDWKEKN
nr:MAG TPA_asm: Rsbr N terminal [Caudoviricetes sp.]